MKSGPFLISNLPRTEESALHKSIRNSTSI